MKNKLLILASNPGDSSRLRLDEEVREIEAGLNRLGPHKFQVISKWAVRPQDIHRALLDHQPRIVHFCGHGEQEGLLFEDDSGQARLADPDALADLFTLFANSVQCVVLNACYSESQARALHRSISHVIGMKKAISDKAAISFAVAFYDAVSAGKSIVFAYELACAAVKLGGDAKAFAPVLLAEKRLPEKNQNRSDANISQKDLKPLAEATGFLFHELSAWQTRLAAAGYENEMPSAAGSDRPADEHGTIAKQDFLDSGQDVTRFSNCCNYDAIEKNSYELAGLMKQLQTHHKNLVDYETAKSEYGALAPPYIARSIEKEVSAICNKTEQLKQLLESIYGKKIIYV